MLFSFSFDAVPTKAQVRLQGKLQNYLAAQSTAEHEFIAARNRIRLQFEKPTDFGGLTIELDLIHSFEKAPDVDLLLKEAYFDWYLDKYDLKIGHQKIIWGRSNGAFVTDIVTPVDLREFLTISAEDIRFGLTSFTAIRYFGSNSLQFVWSPFFQPDLLPSVDSRWFPAQQISNVFSSVPVNNVREDDPYSLEDVQLALRYSLFSPKNLDLDLYLMRWTHPAPAYDLSFDLTDVPGSPSINLVETYQNSWMTGVSAFLKVHSKLFIIGESLIVRNKLFTTVPFSQDLQEDAFSDISDYSEFFQLIEVDGDFLTRKPWIHSMAGIRTKLFQTTIDAQFFVETILEYEEPILQEEIYKYITLLATRSFKRDQLQLLTISRYNMDTEDFWVQFQGEYELNDNLYLTLGTNLFGGKERNEFTGHLSFSRYRKNSFIFSKIAFYF